MRVEKLKKLENKDEHFALKNTKIIKKHIYFSTFNAANLLKKDESIV